METARLLLVLAAVCSLALVGCDLTTPNTGVGCWITDWDCDRGVRLTWRFRGTVYRSGEPLTGAGAVVHVFEPDSLLQAYDSLEWSLNGIGVYDGEIVTH